MNALNEKIADVENFLATGCSIAGVSGDVVDLDVNGEHYILTFPFETDRYSDEMEELVSDICNAFCIDDDNGDGAFTVAGLVESFVSGLLDTGVSD